jgi:hypothetical protein
MEMVEWELIPEDKLKEWAEVLRFYLNDLEADYYHSYKDEVTKKEYFASMILQRLNAGFYNIIGEVKEGDDYDHEDKIDFSQIQQNNEDLHNFWIYAAPYWKGKDNLKESVETEKKELEKRIQALNERLNREYGTDQS